MKLWTAKPVSHLSPSSGSKEQLTRVIASNVGAGIAASRAARGRAGLSRCVGDEVTAVAAVLEGVVKVEPMSDLIQVSNMILQESVQRTS